MNTRDVSRYALYHINYLFYKATLVISFGENPHKLVGERVYFR